MTVLLILLAATAASAPLSQPATRAEVAAQRAAVEQRYAREKAECEQHFVVSTCVEELRRQRHDALVPLVRREHELATEERRDRAAEQTRRVREREQAAAQDEGQRRERVLAAPLPLPSSPASHPVKALSADNAAQARRAADQKSEGEAARRREQAQAREQSQQRRIAEHAARQKSRTKPPAAPLPLPAGSGAAN
ncbi:MAG: hypothetical protein HY020_13700 [Burkholderiales bacterium]|nr:hypothetical protein [Burkholderiales bacterium]